MILPRTKVLQRRREVTSLLVRGIQPSEIAEILNVPRHTIYNDVRYIRSAKNDALWAHTRQEIISQLFLNAFARIRFLWHTADTEYRGHVKVRAMTELRLIDERIIDRLSESGAQVWRTDRHGLISFSTDGRHLEVSSSVNRGMDN